MTCFGWLEIICQGSNIKDKPINKLRASGDTIKTAEIQKLTKERITINGI